MESVTRSAYGYVSGNPLNGTDPSVLKCGWTDPLGCASDAVWATGDFVYEHAGTLSTVASGLATVAYATCAVTAGVGCGVGLALSATSTVLAGVNTYRACVGGQGNCTDAVVGLGLSVVATGAGAVAQRAAAGSLGNVFNSYAGDIYLARQAGVIGGVANFIETVGVLATSFWGSAGFSFDLGLADCEAYQ